MSSLPIETFQTRLLEAVKRPLRWLRTSCKEVSKMRITKKDRLFELFEQDTLKRLFPLLGVDCVFDIGANAGQYATVLRKAVGYRGLIISCEPIPDLARQLRKRAADDNAWHVEELAVTDFDGTTDFHIMRSDQFSSLGTPRYVDAAGFESVNMVCHKLQVRAETLCSLYERMAKTYEFERPFLKMDTQGLDVTIVRAAGSCIRSFVGLQSELAIKRLYQESVDFREAITIYESSGFELTALVPNNEGHFPRLLESDCIMVRRDLWER